MLALGYNKPMICSKLDAFSEHITDGLTGLLFDTGCVSSLADCLIRVMNDESLRKRLAVNVGEVYNCLISWDRIAADTSEVYRELSTSQESKKMSSA